MLRQTGSTLRFVTPLLLTVICLAGSYVISPSAYAQCSRPGFKLNYGHFTNVANKITAADFNADGKMDIAATYYSGGQLAIYFGNGTGEFAAPVFHPVGTSLNRLFAADINNDAKPDIIFVNDSFTGSHSVSTLLNNGSGGFGAPIDSTSFPFYMLSMQMADLNGDGKGDLIYLTNTGIGSSLGVRFGDGLGNFPTANTYTPADPPYRFVIGDFSGDGKLDVALYTYNNVTSRVRIYLNDGSGGLVAAATETTYDGASSIALASDFNADGKVDIAGYTIGGTFDSVMVLLNNGSGGFARTTYPVPTFGRGLRAGDFNGDGKVDLISTGINTFDKSQTLYGNGTGGFTQGESFSSAYGWFDQGDVADFNGDGKSDLVVAVGSGVRVFLRTCNDVSNTKRIDYDGDGQTDFAVWHPSTGEWIIDQSATNTRRTQQWGGGSFGDVPVPGDYDGDGKSDLAVFRAPTGGWYILKSSDNSLFGVQWGASGDKPVPGDYDADGKTDIAVFRPSDGGWYILKSSDNSLSVSVFGTNGDKPVQSDFDNDDKTDVAVYRPANGYWYILKSSDGSFSAVNFGISTDKPAPADYDGDGKTDIAIYRPGVGYYFLSTWNNVATGEADYRYIGTPSAGDLPAPVRRADYFVAYIWRPASRFFGSLSSTPSSTIGTSGDIPVVTPYVVE